MSVVQMHMDCMYGQFNASAFINEGYAVEQDM